MERLIHIKEISVECKYEKNSWTKYEDAKAYMCYHLNAREAQDATSDEVVGGGDVKEDDKDEACTDKDSFCALHLDTWCTNEAAQGTCVRSCCGVLTGPHYGNSHAAEKKRELQQKLKAMGSWDTVCSAQCPVGEEDVAAI